MGEAVTLMITTPGEHNCEDELWQNNPAVNNLDYRKKRDMTSELVLTLAFGLHPLGQRPTWSLLPLWGSAQARNRPGAK